MTVQERRVIRPEIRWWPMGHEGRACPRGRSRGCRRRWRHRVPDGRVGAEKNGQQAFVHHPSAGGTPTTQGVGATNMLPVVLDRCGPDLGS
jgi:hypothetical protein